MGFILPLRTSNIWPLFVIPDEVFTSIVYKSISSSMTSLRHKTGLSPDWVLPSYFGALMFMYSLPFFHSTPWCFGKLRIFASNFTHAIAGCVWIRVTSGGPAKFKQSISTCLSKQAYKNVPHEGKLHSSRAQKRVM